MAARQVDLVVWGATGFTGRLVSQHLAASYPAASGVRWALAGRSRARLEALRTELAVKYPAAADAPLLECADTSNEAALDAVVGAGRVVLTLAGPYALYGKPLVASAVRTKTHYCDITGESGFMADCIKDFDAPARAAGVCLVNSCGYDCVPWDLGASMALRQLREAGVSGAVRVDGLVGATQGGVSGGTIASLMNALETPGSRGSGVHSLDPDWAGRPDREPSAGPVYNAAAQRWTMLSVMASVNERIVHRSAALQPKLYGERGSFEYHEATLAPGLFGAVVGTAAMASGLLMLLLKPTRALLQRTLLPLPGQGPSEKVREGGCFAGHFVATEGAPAAGKAPRRAYALVGVKGADPGYKATSIMCCEAALSLALQHEELPAAGRAGGLLTPAVALGDVLAERLRKRGFTLSARLMQEGERMPETEVTTSAL